MPQLKPSPHTIPGSVFVKLVPADDPEPGEDSAPALPEPRTPFWQSGAEILSQFGEWMGVTGPRATLMSRLTVAAVGLVLVSGISLLLAPSDPPQPARTRSAAMDVVPAAGVVAEHKTSPRPTSANTGRRPRSQIVQTQADSSSPATVESASWQAAPAHPRAAWLDGTIETE